MTARPRPAAPHGTHKGSRYILPCPTPPLNVPRGFHRIVGLVGELGGATQNVAESLVGAVGGVEWWELDMPVTASCIFLRFFGNLSFRGDFLLCPLCLFCVMPLPWHLISDVAQPLTTGKEAITRKAKTWDSLFPVFLIVSRTLLLIVLSGLCEEYPVCQAGNHGTC